MPVQMQIFQQRKMTSPVFVYKPDSIERHFVEKHLKDFCGYTVLRETGRTWQILHLYAREHFTLVKKIATFDSKVTPKNHVTSFAFSKNTKVFVAVYWLEKFVVWNVDDINPVFVHKRRCDYFTRTYLSDDGCLLALHENKRFQVWNLNTKKILYSVENQDMFNEKPKFDGVIFSQEQTALIVQIKKGWLLLNLKAKQQFVLPNFSTDVRSFSHKTGEFVCYSNGDSILCDFWTPIQQLLSKYILPLTKSKHLSLSTLMAIFESIVLQKKIKCFF